MIELPFPPATLSGHNTGHYHVKTPIVAEHREWAKIATLGAKNLDRFRDTEGDILVSVTFYPPDRRGDRTNYPNRMKPYLDGIADALGINDRRFHPSYYFADPEKPGKVVVTLTLPSATP